MKVKVKGEYKDFSEETLGLAVEEYVLGHPEAEPNYQFKAGDVARSEYGSIRIILNTTRSTSDEKLVSYDLPGQIENADGQEGFEDYGYKKIGRLSDFIK